MPQNVAKRGKGRPPKVPNYTEQDVLDAMLGDPSTAAAPLGPMLALAESHLRKREFAQSRACLNAARRVVEAAETEAQLSQLHLNFGDSMMHRCDCGHLRAQHVEGKHYCRVCMYKISGMGWHGCKGFAAQSMPQELRQLADSAA